MVRFPSHLERQYAARLLRRLRVARLLLEPRLRDLQRGRHDNEAAKEGWGGRFRAVVAAVRRAFSVVMPAEPESLVPTAQAVDSWATRTTTREVERLVQVDVEGDTRLAGSRAEQRVLHWQWARENVGLITSMEARTFDDLADHVVRAVVEGRTDLAAVLRDRFGVAEGRARLIARDQVAKLNARITQERQVALGIRAYEWSSSGDERVRPLHRELDGTIRRWDDPHPTEGHPGVPIACRCVALPVLDDALVPEPRSPAQPAPPTPPPPAPAQPPALPTLPPEFGGLPAPPPPAVPPPPPAPAALEPAPPPEPSATPVPLDLTGVDLSAVLPDARTPEGRARALHHVFGRPTSLEEVLSWTGIEQGDLGPETTIEVDRNGWSLDVVIETPDFEARRTYRRPLPDKLVADHVSLEVFEGRTGRGTALFARAVDELSRAGFSRINTFAAGNAREAEEDAGYNGYYTWPRLGYDAALDPDDYPPSDRPPSLRAATTVQELFRTAEGRSWWKANGNYIHMEFDLAPGSRSREVLDAYVRERAERDATKREDAATATSDARRRPREEIDLSPEDEAALDRAWATLDR